MSLRDQARQAAEKAGDDFCDPTMIGDAVFDVLGPALDLVKVMFSRIDWDDQRWLSQNLPEEQKKILDELIGEHWRRLL